MNELVLYSRPGCHLCDDMAQQLQPVLAAANAQLTVVNIDEDPVLKERYGLRIPVLTLDGEVLSEARLDEDAVRDALGVS